MSGRELFFVAGAGRLTRVNQILEQKPALEFKECCGRTPLIVAAEEGQVEVCKALLAAGCNKDAVSTYGWTPLMVAARFNHVAVVNMLCEAGADKTLRDMSEGGGRTALDLARMHKHESIIKLLESGSASAA